jgi:putative toxin-antitoxin system antitoxin component (TIGR02293 family)
MAEAYGYLSLLGLHPHGPVGKLFQQVQRGLAFSALERFQRKTGLATAELANVVRIPMRTLHRRKEEGRLAPEESDRLLRVSRVFGKAIDLFEGDAAAAREWLGAPQKGLDGERPMVLVKTDLGAREVEALIDRLEHGVLT